MDLNVVNLNVVVKDGDGAEARLVRAGSLVKSVSSSSGVQLWQRRFG